MNYYGEDETVSEYITGSWEAVKYARTAQSFLDPELGLPILQAQFNSYRNFFWVAGILALMQESAERSTCCEDWAASFGLPEPDILITLTKDMQRAYIQGIALDHTGASTDVMQYWYAEIITNREKDDQAVVEAIEEGQIPITQTEASAAEQANVWRDMVIAGGAEREQALREAMMSDSGAILNNWESSVPLEIDATKIQASIPVSASKVTSDMIRTDLSKFGSLGMTHNNMPFQITGGDLVKVASGGVAVYLFLEAVKRIKDK